MVILGYRRSFFIVLGTLIPWKEIPFSRLAIFPNIFMVIGIEAVQQHTQPCNRLLNIKYFLRPTQLYFLSVLQVICQPCRFKVNKKEKISVVWSLTNQLFHVFFRPTAHVHSRIEINRREKKIAFEMVCSHQDKWRDSIFEPCLVSNLS